MFEQALALDPQSVETHSLLASMLAGRVLAGMTNTRTADIRRANDLIDQALAACPAVHLRIWPKPNCCGRRGGAMRPFPN